MDNKIHSGNKNNEENKERWKEKEKLSFRYRVAGFDCLILAVLAVASLCYQGKKERESV